MATTGSSSNQSWMSSSSFGSITRDHEDDQSIDDSSSKDPNNNNNNNNNTNSSTLSSSSLNRSRGDRYNHYRRDPPTKVKPWLRDKAVTGTTTGGVATASSSKRTSRFLGGSSRSYSSNHSNNNNIHNNSTFALSEASVGSNSCANSVSSVSSFPEASIPRSQEHQHQHPQQYGEVITRPRHVPVQVLTNSHRTMSSHTYDDVDNDNEDQEEAEKEEGSSTRSMNTNVAVRQQYNESFSDHRRLNSRAKGESNNTTTVNVDHDVTHEATNDDAATVDTEAASTAETPLSISDTYNDNDKQQTTNIEADHNDGGLDEPPLHDENKIDTNGVATPADTPAAATLEEERDDGSVQENVAMMMLEQANDTLSITAATNMTSKLAGQASNQQDVDTTTTARYPALSHHANDTDDDDDSRNHSLPPPQPQSPAVVVDKKILQQHDEQEEFYDVLLSVQPSTYNPMMSVTVPKLNFQHATTTGTTDKPVSVTAYATLDKPTPMMVEAHAAVFQNAIEEEASDADDDDDDDDYNYNYNYANKDDKDNDEIQTRDGEPSKMQIDDDHLGVSSVLVSREDHLVATTSSVDSNKNLPVHANLNAAVTATSVNGSLEVPAMTDACCENRPIEVEVEVEGCNATNNLPGVVEERSTSVISKETLDEMNRIKEDIARLEQSNEELVEKLKQYEDKEKEYEAKNVEFVAESMRHMEQVEQVRKNMEALESIKSELEQKLRDTEQLVQEQAAKNTDAAACAKEQTEQMKKLDDEVKRLSEMNSGLEEKLRATAESLKSQEAKNADAVASSEAQAEMMNSLCEELKRLEETNADLQEKLKVAEETSKAQEASLVAAQKANIEATQKIASLNDELKRLDEANAGLLKKLNGAEEREKLQASREQNITLVHVGDMPVDVGRFRVQCQKYFNCLRVSQLKNHSIRDKSPVKLVIPYFPQERKAIDIQALLDKGSAIEAQDTTYLFKSLDTFNKGHFHSYKLLIPWKIVSTDGNDITRSEFFSQVWHQLGGLKVVVGDKKTEIPLFQESKGTLIPMPNAVLEGKLQCSPSELDRIFAGRIAPYYRAIGRMIVQCIAATADDSSDHSLKISGSAMPLILRHKLFRGVDPVDESYPLDHLLNHAFSLLGIDDMTRDKAFEYFSIDVRSYPDVNEAVKRVREEVHEMWIKERSLAIRALEEGLTLNGLADMSFCCGLVPLEAVNEIIFTSQ